MVVAPFMAHTVELEHPGGETKTLIIETIQRTYVTVRWGMSGLYDIHLKQNVMIARSMKARNRAKCYWRVKDIESLRKLVDEYFAETKKEQMDLSFDRHVNSMPFKE